MTTDPKNYRLLFFGSSEFSLPALLAIFRSGWNVVAVITQPDRPKGRKQELSPTPIKKEAKNLRLQVEELATLRDPEALAKLKALNADAAIVVSYGQIIPEAALKLARKGFVNLHPSLLPKYRGASPIQFALLHGESKTGVTLMEMDSQLDHGPIIGQTELAINPEESYPVLHERLAETGAELLVKLLPDWLIGKVASVKQDDRKATYTKILTRDDGRVNWKKTAEEISRQVRAFIPWPGTWTQTSTKRYKILLASLPNLSLSLPPGHVRIVKNDLLVGCGNQTLLQIDAIQEEGGKPLLTPEFLRGHSLTSGQQFV